MRACYRSELVAAWFLSSDVLTPTDFRTGEGISVQTLRHPHTSHRDRARRLSHRTTDQDLVSEPAHEGQEGEDADHGAQRAGKFGVVMATSAAAAAAAASCSNAARRCRDWQCGRSLTPI